MNRIAVGAPGEASHPDVLKAGLAEFFSMIIFVFAGQGSGMAFSMFHNFLFSKFIALLLLFRGLVMIDMFWQVRLQMMGQVLLLALSLLHYLMASPLWLLSQLVLIFRVAMSILQ